MSNRTTKRRGRPKVAEPIDWNVKRQEERRETMANYSGGSWKRCPRCQSANTIATRTAGPVEQANGCFILQYRKCRNPVCRHTFKAFRPD